MDSLRQTEPFVNGSIRHFLSQLRGKTGERIDLGEWFQFYAIGIVFYYSLSTVLLSPSFIIIYTKHND
jgi:hypothetical protein